MEKGEVKEEGGSSEGCGPVEMASRMSSVSLLDWSEFHCCCQSRKVEMSPAELAKRRRLWEVESQVREVARLLCSPIQVMDELACGRVDEGTQMKA